VLKEALICEDVCEMEEKLRVVFCINLAVFFSEPTRQRSGRGTVLQTGRSRVLRPKR
jgi:hypothetical protein